MIKRVMISQLHTQYPKGTLLVLYYIDPKMKHYIQKKKNTSVLKS
jgi:hypothetical protein